jgi:predicted porin
MKKSLFALAAVTAFAGAAQAQSSVTVYGILDVGYIGGNNRDFTSSGAATKNTYNNLGGNGSESTNRIGFRGTEDIGGGTRAFFTVEVQLNPSFQGSSGTGPIGANRQTFAGLSQKGLGNFSIGTQYTPIHNAIGATSAGQQNNMVGDVIYPIAPPGQSGAGIVGTSALAASSSTGLSGQSGTTAAYTVRTNNMLRVQSENMAGFVASAFYTMADNNQTVAGANSSSNTTGESNRNGWGLGVNYTWKKLLVSANYQSFKAAQPTNTTVGLWTSTATASNIQDNQMYFGAAYDFGILKAYAQYINRKATSELDSTQFLQRSAQQIGVRGFATKTIEGWASAGTGRYDSYGTGAPTVNFTGYQLGANYWLSKRSNLYAIFGSTQQSSSGVATQPSYGANNYAVGVRHTF